MTESQEVAASTVSGAGCKSVYPSNYWGRGNLNLSQAIISPELGEETSSEAQEETQSPIQQECKPS